jgi:hypothetical protein
VASSLAATCVAVAAVAATSVVASANLDNQRIAETTIPYIGTLHQGLMDEW